MSDLHRSKIPLNCELRLQTELWLKSMLSNTEFLLQRQGTAPGQHTQVIPTPGKPWASGAALLRARDPLGWDPRPTGDTEVPHPIRKTTAGYLMRKDIPGYLMRKRELGLVGMSMFRGSEQSPAQLPLLTLHRLPALPHLFPALEF